MVNRRRLAVAGVVVMSLALAGCAGATTNGGDSSGSLKPNQSITAAVAGEPTSMDPQLVADPGMKTVLWQVYESLTTLDKGKVVPLLAESMPTQVDDTTWDIKLKKGVTFSDGTPFNADAVVYSITRMSGLGPDHFVSQLAEAADLKGAEKVSDSEVHVFLKTPDPLTPNKLTNVKMLEVNGADHFSTPVGTGPYVVKSYVPGSGQAVLAYNDKFRGTKPQVTNVTIKFIPDPGTRVQALQAGEVQFLPGLNPDNVSQAPKTIFSSVPEWTAFMRLNYNNPVLANVKVRQAINYAIDKSAVVNKLFPKGMAQVNTCQSGPFQSGDGVTTTKPYAYDPKKAKSLISDAGATGAELHMTWISGAFPYDTDVAQLVTQELNATGLKIDLKLVDLTDLITEIAKKQSAATDIMGNVIADSLGTVARLPGGYYPENGSTSTTRDAKLTSLTAAAFAAPSGPSRVDAWQALAGYACDSAAIGFLYDWRDLYGVAANISYDPPGPSNQPEFSRIVVSSTK